MRGVALQPSGDKVSCDDASCPSVDNHEVHHLAAGMQLHCATCYLAAQGAVGAEQQLLSGLAFGIERPADLRATKGTVVEQSAVVAGKRHTLRHTLVDDGVADLSQTIDVSLSSSIITTFDGVAEQTLHAVAVVLVVLRRIDTSLRRNGMRTAWRVLDAEDVNIEAQSA